MLRLTAPLRPSLAILALAVALSGVVGAAARPLPVLARDGTTFVELANVKRASVGKAPVGFHSKIDQISVERGDQMAKADKLYHDMTYIGRRLSELGVCYSSYGEIIYWEKGYPTFSVQRAIDAWWASSGHHKIMVGDFNAAGGSWSQAASGGRYAVMIFVKVCGSAPPPPSTTTNVTRIAGSDRYATAAKVSSAHFAAGVPVVYVATGEGYPDALAAGAVAGKRRVPLLLVKRGAIPTVTAQELSRLKPGSIVVLGGTGAISDAVLTALRGYTAGGVSRVAGSDRYATAAAVSKAAFSPGVAVAYLATGAGFADSLAGGAAAGLQPGPILLVKSDRIPDSTATELARLKPGRIVLLGGVAVIGSAVANAAAKYTTGSVSRLAGSDRYATAVAVSKAHYGSAAKVYVATGGAYPDGLSATPPAVGAAGPVLLVRPDVLPSVVADELRRLNPDRVVILGGTSVISSSVAAAIDAIVD